MARHCELTGKKANNAFAISHSHRRTKRLQEANLGLAAIAEIQAAIVELRAWQPVIGLIAGSVGCFGGMSIAAGLCTRAV